MIESVSCVCLSCVCRICFVSFRFVFVLFGALDSLVMNVDTYIPNRSTCSVCTVVLFFFLFHANSLVFLQ